MEYSCRGVLIGNGCVWSAKVKHHFKFMMVNKLSETSHTPWICCKKKFTREENRGCKRKSKIKTTRKG